MNATSRFTRELETLLSDAAFSGLKNIHPGTLDKLAVLEKTAEELGMRRGARLLKNFAEALRTWRLNEKAAGGETENLAKMLCSLDFYNKNLTGNNP
jgi:hypothetical protein